MNARQVWVRAHEASKIAHAMVDARTAAGLPLSLEMIAAYGATVAAERRAWRDYEAEASPKMPNWESEHR